MMSDTSSNLYAIMAKALNMASVGPVMVTILSGQFPSEIFMRALLCRNSLCFNNHVALTTAHKIKCKCYLLPRASSSQFPLSEKNTFFFLIKHRLLYKSTFLLNTC